MKRTGNLVLIIFLTGFITGTLDAIAAMLINYKIPQTAIWRFIASGVFGKDEAKGTNMVAWGLTFHYLIATIFSAILFLFYPFIKMIFRFKYLIGTLYGCFVWCVMNLIVVPLSHAPRLHFHIGTALLNLLALILAVGIPSALIAYRYYSPQYKK